MVISFSFGNLIINGQCEQKSLKVSCMPNIYIAARPKRYSKSHHTIHSRPISSSQANSKESHKVDPRKGPCNHPCKNAHANKPNQAKTSYTTKRKPRPLPSIPKNLLGALHHVLFKRRHPPPLHFRRRLAIPLTHQMRRDWRDRRERHVRTIRREGHTCLRCREA
jgi:hypothetical protein